MTVPGHVVEPISVPLRLGLEGLAQLWDRRASEAAGGAAAEAYQRAAAEAKAVLQALAPVYTASRAPALAAQEELPF